jgi:hypothetical protein
VHRGTPFNFRNTRVNQLLLRQRNALTLWRERFDRVALASNCSAAVRSQISGCITCLAVGDTNKFVLPDDGDLYSHRMRAGKSSHPIKEVLNEGPSEFITSRVGPGSVLKVAQSVAV